MKKLFLAALTVSLISLLGTAQAAKTQTGDEDDLSDLEVQRKTARPKPAAPLTGNGPGGQTEDDVYIGKPETTGTPNALPPGNTVAPTASPSSPAKILLVDDDVSDNNNISGNTRLSASDSFYRKQLQDRGLGFDTLVVSRYANGPNLDQLRGHTLIIWYTGAAYGGSRANTISTKDEATLRSYLEQTGGSVLLISPGYLNDALGSGEAGWARTESAFLHDVFGIKGGRGLLQRFKDGAVTSRDGATFNVVTNKFTQVQFSALNPASAQVVFNAVLDPDGTGPRPVAVTTSQVVGQGHMVYVGFTFENIAGDAGTAFGRLLQAVGTATETPPPVANPMRVRTNAITTATMQITGTRRPPFLPKTVTTTSMQITGTRRPPFLPKVITTAPMLITGTRPPPRSPKTAQPVKRPPSAIDEPVT